MVLKHVLESQTQEHYSVIYTFYKKQTQKQFVYWATLINRVYSVKSDPKTRFRKPDKGALFCDFKTRFRKTNKHKTTILSELC